MEHLALFLALASFPYINVLFCPLRWVILGATSTPDPAAKRFSDVRGWSRQSMGSNLLASFTEIKALGSRSIAV